MTYTASAGKRKDLHRRRTARRAMTATARPAATDARPRRQGRGHGLYPQREKWREICVNMDTICENSPVDTSFTLFGRTFAIPAFAAPVGAMRLHYGDKYDDLTYNDILVRACANAGILAFTGDGTDPKVVEGAAEALKAQRRLRRADHQAVGYGHDPRKIRARAGIRALRHRDGHRRGGSAVFAGLDAAGRQQERRGVKADRPLGAASVHSKGHHDRPRRGEGAGGGRERHRGLEPRRPCARPLPRDGGGAAGDCRCRRRQDDDFCRRRDPQRHGHVQGAGARCGRGAHRPPVRYHRLWRRGGGRAALRREAQSRACRHDAHVRRALARGAFERTMLYRLLIEYISYSIAPQEKADKGKIGRRGRRG